MKNRESLFRDVCSHSFPVTLIHREQKERVYIGNVFLVYGQNGSVDKIVVAEKMFIVIFMFKKRQTNICLSINLTH